MSEFDGKVALVTGASRGIGRATAVAFAERGARVAVHYVSDEAGASRPLPGDGHIVVRADLADADAVRAMVDDVAARLGGIDILVNNAGVYLEHRILDATFEEWREAWRRTIDVNLIGAANVTYCAVRHMVAHGGGAIVNVSSRGAFRGEPTHPAYAASKGGLNAMSGSLAQALAPHNITVTTVAPGFVDTDMASSFLSGPQGDAIRAQSPMGRVATPEDVASVVMFLASEGARFATGTIVDVNGASYLRT